jgi:hypothetical protein
VPLVPSRTLTPSALRVLTPMFGDLSLTLAAGNAPLESIALKALLNPQASALLATSARWELSHKLQEPSVPPVLSLPPVY